MQNFSFWDKCKKWVDKIFLYFNLGAKSLKGVGKKMCWKKKYYNKVLVNASNSNFVIICSFIK
jgi:hypothetical protein